MGIRDFFRSKKSEKSPSENVQEYFLENNKDYDTPAQFLDDDQVEASEDKIDVIQEADNAFESLTKQGVPNRETDYPGPVGLDVGTANIVTAHGGAPAVKTFIQLNAFYAIPYSSITKQTLLRDDIPFFQKDQKLYILGYHSEDFASMMAGEIRRPIDSGILNPKEVEAISVIKALINGLVKKPKKWGEKICFSIPGDPLDGQTSVVYHESIIRMHLKSLGYTPIPINEGLAVVLAELSGNNYTGIGISMGGGMCNVCFSYLSVPVMSFSIQKGGDYIDAMVANSVGESPTRVRMIKEKDLDLSAEPETRVETGLHIFYDDLFRTLLQGLNQVLGTSEKLPRLSKPIPIVLSGGTVLPKGTREKFIKTLQEIRLPIKISEIIITKKPLYATAKGALVLARTEEAEV
jgi:hypothetical protein